MAFSIQGLSLLMIRALVPVSILIHGDGQARPVQSSVPAIEGLGEVLSLDVVASGNDIHALLVGTLNAQDRPTVLYTVSHDGGISWMKPVVVNHDRSAVISKRGNDAQLAVHGNSLAAVWQRAGEFPIAGPMVMAFSKDGGATWESAQPPSINDPANNQSYFDLAADRYGHFHMVWLDDREENGITQGLRYAVSLDGGRHWQERDTVDGTVCTCCWNRLTTLADDSVVVLYRDDAPHDMKLARKKPQDRAWRPLGTVGAFRWNFTGCPHCGGGLASISESKTIWFHSVVWTGKENMAGLYYLASAYPKLHWSRPIRIADDHAREADIAALSTQTLGIVYSRPVGSGRAIYYRQSNDGGKHWREPQLLSELDHEADHPRILAIPKGFRVFWTERPHQGGRVLKFGFPTLS